MARRTIPETDLAFLAWARNFSETLNQSPESFGVDPAAAGEFASLLESFAEAVRICSGNERSKAATTVKTEVAARLRLSARRLVSVIRGYPLIRSEQLVSLNIVIREPRSPKIAEPVEAPAVSVLSMVGHAIAVEIRQQAVAHRRRRMPGTAGAMIYTWTGDHPPRDLNEWTLKTTATRSKVELAFDASVPPGTKVHVCAAWVNPRLQRGPVSSPVVGYIQFGGPMQMTSSVRAAA